MYRYLILIVWVLLAVDGQDCTNPEYVYETHIIYGGEDIFGEFADIFSEIEPELNTFERRTKYFRYYSDTFGVQFDPQIPGEQTDATGNFFAQPTMTVFPNGYRVMAFDTSHPNFRQSFGGKFPISNAEFKDMSFWMIAIANSTSPSGTVFKEGDIVFAGSYLLFIEGVYAGLELFYTPTGNAFATRFRLPTTLEPYFPRMMTCDIESEEFGFGIAYLACYQYYLDENSILLGCSNRMQFPRMMSEIDPTGPVTCDDLDTPGGPSPSSPPTGSCSCTGINRCAGLSEDLCGRSDLCFWECTDGHGQTPPGQTNCCVGDQICGILQQFDACDGKQICSWNCPRNGTGEDVTAGQEAEPLGKERAATNVVNQVPSGGEHSPQMSNQVLPDTAESPTTF